MDPRSWIFIAECFLLPIIYTDMSSMKVFQVLQYITTKSCLGAKDEDGDDEEMDGNQENGDKSKRPEMESETPWVSLASLALFKLFNDWQAQVHF